MLSPNLFKPQTDMLYFGTLWRVTMHDIHGGANYSNLQCADDLSLLAEYTTANYSVRFA